MSISAVAQPANPWDWYGAYPAQPAGAAPGGRTSSVISKKKTPTIEAEMERKLNLLEPPTIFDCIDSK